MATRSVLAYTDNTADIRGTYVHFDGHPDSAVPLIQQLVHQLGYQGVVNWIETGISGGGFRSYADTKPFGDIKTSESYPVNAEEFGYLVQPDGSIDLVHSTDPLTPARDHR